MARPKKCRRICREPSFEKFIPDGIPSHEEVFLTVDEYEVLRLLDYEKKTQEECAAQMGVARTTVTAMVETARYKAADSLVNGKPLLIGGGHYKICNGFTPCDCQDGCERTSVASPALIRVKGENIMRVAVTYDNGNIFQHFGHTETFKLYDIEDKAIKETQVVSAAGSAHGTLPTFLKEHQVDVLICGGIGAGAQQGVAGAGIELFGGVHGSADDAVDAYLAGTLAYNPNVRCSDHGHGHEHGNHSCGDHGGCGSH